MLADPSELAIVLKRFENPNEVREFARGRFELVNMIPCTSLVPVHCSTFRPSLTTVGL
jgi:hypothetical protein